MLSAGNAGKDLRTTEHFPNPGMNQDNVFVVGSDSVGTNFGGRVDFHITEGNDHTSRNESKYISSVPGGQVESKKGTSFSAAYTTGVISLALGMNPSLDPQNLRDLLMKNTIPYNHSSGVEARQIVTYGFLKEVLADRSP